MVIVKSWIVVLIFAKNVTFVAPDLPCLALKSRNAPTHISLVIIEDAMKAMK